MVRQAVRQAHGPEQSRRTHHPEPGRRANHNDRNSKSQTIWLFILFEIWILKFICDLVLAICYFQFIRV